MVTTLRLRHAFATGDWRRALDIIKRSREWPSLAIRGSVTDEALLTATVADDLQAALQTHAQVPKGERHGFSFLRLSAVLSARLNRNDTAKAYVARARRVALRNEIDPITESLFAAIEQDRPLPAIA
jgi:hypothetical protein